MFATLVYELGTHTKTNEKLDALVKYFSSAADKDKVWMIALFSGRSPRRTISRIENSRMVFRTCWDCLYGYLKNRYHTVGDMSETIALLIPEDIAEEK